jgi:hypothetical protein
MWPQRITVGGATELRRRCRSATRILVNVRIKNNAAWLTVQTLVT